MKTLLIANRGEIAVRIARTARSMGIATVAVHSDADAATPHVRACDAAVRIGPAPAAQSYLDIQAILDAARRSGADAIHPGYGFLSENAAFARAVADAGFVFVGPGPEAIAAMGDKAQAKAIARQAGLPVIDGYDGHDQSAQRLVDEAIRIGFPLMVKAAAGGGGRGMRVVREPAMLDDAIASARREAEAAFGDGRLLLERLVENARHVEVQVFGDAHGNVVHLLDRDCSAQRRHQKLVEEAPAANMRGDTAAALAGDAVKLARAVGYVGAGTVEFVIDGTGAHRFLEMNTRLQVEHPVTEAITGLDLVEWQLRVARGEALPLRQQDILAKGHAIEVRLCAEDVPGGFLPQSGRIGAWSPPRNARVDAGIDAGSVVSPHYDSMIAKIIVHGADRAGAIVAMLSALDATHLAGVATNRAFLRDLVDSAAFRDGAVTTALIDAWIAGPDAADAPPALRRLPPDRETVAVAAAVIGNAGGDWFRSTGVADCPLELRSGDSMFYCRLRFAGGGLAAVEVNGERCGIEGLRIGERSVEFVEGGVARRAACAMIEGELWLDIGGSTHRFREVDHLAGSAAQQDGSRIIAPLAGLVRRVHVAPGDHVDAAAPLIVIEAMKMETVLAARGAGTVRAVHAAEGRQVAAGDLLAEIVADV